jgi:hypothetical protein
MPAPYVKGLTRPSRVNGGKFRWFKPLLDTVAKHASLEDLWSPLVYIVNEDVKLPLDPNVAVSNYM